MIWPLREEKEELSRGDKPVGRGRRWSDVELYCRFSDFYRWLEISEEYKSLILSIFQGQDQPVARVNCVEKEHNGIL